MIIQFLMDTPRVRDYIDSISDGFQKNPGEIIASIAGVAVLLFFLLFLALWWRKKEERKRKEKSKLVFSVISERLNLTFSEIELLKRLASVSPGGEYSLPALAKNQQQFNLAVKRALRRKSIGESEIAALRFRLGHIKSNERGILNSTASLKPGTSVEIVIPGKENEYGSVVEVQPANFCVKVLSEASLSGQVELRFARPTGIYSCTQHVVRHHDGICEFRHTEVIKRIQKRGSLRKKVVMSVVVLSDGEKYRGTLIDLSEGGARVECSDIPFKKNQTIDIMLFEKSAEPITVTAEIVRIEGEINRIGVEFKFLDTKTKERIINTVFH